MRELLLWVAFATLLTQIRAEKFSCEGRASGYYADVDTGCQVYHMCDGLGRQFSYSCPNTTLFQQRMLICDHWYMVNCSKSEVDYKANLLIGQKDKPFVEDSSEHPYHRTPRPDLLEQPYAPRYQDDAYRQGRAQSLPSSLNLVGVATDDDAEDEQGNRKNFTTDRPQYFLPSHWSTQYGKSFTTPIPAKVNNIKTSKPINTFHNKSPIIPDKKLSSSDSKNPNTPPRKIPVQNFNYNNQKFSKTPPKVTIPSSTHNFHSGNNDANEFNSIKHRVDNDNIPDSINQESASPSSLALPPFIPNKPQILNKPPQIVLGPPQIQIKQQLETQQPQNSKKLQVNTSQSPQRPVLLPKLPQVVPRAPESSFKVPQNIETSTKQEIPNLKSNIPEIPKPSIYYQPPKFSSSFDIESTTMDPQTFYKLVPSKELLPPPAVQQTRTLNSNQQKIKRPQVSSTVSTPSPVNSRITESDKLLNKKSANENQTKTSAVPKDHSDLSEKRWKELRQMFFIPEYDFPLETGNRPSYESGLSSFQVNSDPPIPESLRRSDTKTPDSRFSGNNPGMKFQESTKAANPDCPKCDPDFLAPGTCKPCVMIRR